MAREVVITGMGMILPNCYHRKTLWSHLSEGCSQLSLMSDPSDPEVSCAIGYVHDFEPSKYLGEIPERYYSSYPRELQFYLASVILAKDDARLVFGDISPERIGLFDGSSRPALAFWHERVLQEAVRTSKDLYSRKDIIPGLSGQTVGVAASLFKITGPTYAYAGSCCAGGMAVGNAFREISSGEIDVAFASGHDAALVAPLFAMYRQAGLISKEDHDASRAIMPYGGDSNIAFGEGAITLVLEAREGAERRAARILAGVRGYKHGNAGMHPMRIDSEGKRPAALLCSLFQSAGIDSGQVDFVVGHGNGVHLSDVSEENYMRLIFGKTRGQVPLISTKPIYGHTLGASSSLNIAAATLMLHKQSIIPTLNGNGKKQHYSSGQQASLKVKRRCKLGVSMSYGMGGHNTALLLERL